MGAPPALGETMDQQLLHQLVEAASKGDKNALSKICELKAKSILYQSIKIMESRPDGEDVAQNVVEKVCQNIGQLRNPALFNAWLRSIIVNECNRMLKKNYKYKHITPIEGQEAYLVETNTEFLPQEYAENEELRKELLGAIEKLPKKRRELMMLHYYEQLSYAEIALLHKTSVGAVSSGIAKAKKTIRRALEKERGGRLQGIGIAGAVPVLSRVFEADVANIVPPESVSQLVATSHKIIEAAPALAVGGGTAVLAAKGATTGTGAALGLKIGAIAAVSALALAGCIALVRNGGTGPNSPEGPMIETITAPALPHYESAEASPGAFVPGESSDIEGASPPEDAPGESGTTGSPEGPANGALDSPSSARAEEETPEATKPPPSGPGGSNAPPSAPAAMPLGITGEVYLKDSAGNAQSVGGTLDGAAVLLLDSAGNTLAESRVQNGTFTLPRVSAEGSKSCFIQLLLGDTKTLVMAADHPDGKAPVTLTAGQDASVRLFVSAAPPPQVRISLTGADCACGHVNPKSASLVSDSSAPLTANWRIERQDGGAVSSGEGTSIAAALQNMRSGGQDGRYTILFDYTDGMENQGTKRISILIDSGRVEENQYE